MEKKEIKPYIREVHYYETDGMQIVHHSNYIRWMEEARTDYLEQAELPYAMLVENGIQLPVLSVTCNYKTPVVFGDTVKIYMEVEWYNGTQFEVSYRMVSMDETKLHITGSTLHCFLNPQLQPVILKRRMPEAHEKYCLYAKELRRPLKPKKAEESTQTHA